MKKLIVAVLAAIMIMPTVAHAWSSNPAEQVLEYCKKKHGSQDARDACMVQGIEDAYAATRFEERRKEEARADLKKWKGWLGYWQPHAQMLEKKLKSAEDRIRELERELRHHKSGGYWNPTNW